MSSTTHSHTYGWNGVNWDKTQQTSTGDLKVSVENTTPIAVSGSFAADISGQYVNVANNTDPATATKQDAQTTILSSVDGKITACDTGAVVVSSSALPSGASTSANQLAGNSSLSSMDSKITACDTGAVVVSASALPTGAATSANQLAGNSSLSSMDGKITACDTGAVVVSSSALPSGAATASLQTSGNASLTALEGSLYADGDAISVSDNGVLVMGRDNTNSAHPLHITANGDLEVEIADFVKGQAVSASSFPVVLASDQSTLATDPVDTRASSTMFNAQVIVDGGSATSSTLDMDGYKYLQVLGSTTNTSNSVATFEWSVDNVNWYKSNDEYIPQDFSSGDFSFILPNAVARYVRWTKSNSSGASETITLIAAQRKN